MNQIIRKVYLYLVTFIGIVVTVIGCINILDLGLKTFIFKEADSFVEYPRPVPLEEGKQSTISKEEQEKYHQKELVSRRQRQASSAIAMIVVGFPLYKYHWHTLKKEK